MVHRARSAGRPRCCASRIDAVQRDPGLEPAVGEVLPAAAGLPDALVGLVPVLAQPVDDARQRGPALVADLHAGGVGEVDRGGGLAVDVELQLVGGAVADPDRPRAAPALEMIQALLDQVRGAVHPVHDLQRPGTLARLFLRPVPEPGAERGGLLHVAQAEQRVDGERAVPDPGVAVVPVALPAFLLGQPGGRRRDRGPGRRVGHQLQRDRRTGDHLAPAAGVAGPVQPAAPEPRRVILQPLRLLGGHEPGRAAHRLQDHSRRTRPPAGSGSTAPRHRRAASVSPRLRSGGSLRRDGVHRQLQVLGPEHPAMLEGLQLVRLAAVVEARLDLDREPHDPADHPDVADQPVPAGRRALDDRHEVVDLADPVRGHEPGDQDRGVGQVQLPGHVVVPVRRDPVETAAVGVQQRREHAGRVEPGTAEPVQDAVRRHQRRRLQVTDQPMVSDIRVTRHRFLLRVAKSHPPWRRRPAGHITRHG